jgi:hypothetical protein
MFVKFSTNISFWELAIATCEFLMNLVQIKGPEFKEEGICGETI